MDSDKLIYGVATAVLTALIVGAWRWGAKLTDRVKDTEAFIGFLKAYLLKNAVLEFHSPNPAHKEADKVIERLVQGEDLSAHEIGTLARRIETVAKTSEDAKRRLRATETLVLMDEFMEAVTGHKYTAFAEFE